MSNAINAHDLWAISRLFSYPDAQTISAPIPDGVGVEAEALFVERTQLDPILLENEYVRLFVNALPEVPCAPYGSVYLEGTVMGESTVKVAHIYRQYGMEHQELADHIAVESEFLAWLHGKVIETPPAREDFDYLFGHLRQWTTPFFDQVIQHDQLGCYRQCAQWARRMLADLA